MKTLLPLRFAPWILTLLLLMVPATAQAQAQNQRMVVVNDDGEVQIEIKDGRVLVNGEEAEPDADGRVVIRSDSGGQDIVISPNREGHYRVFVGDEGDLHQGLWYNGGDQTWVLPDGQRYAPRLFSGEGADLERQYRRRFDDDSPFRGAEGRGLLESWRAPSGQFYFKQPDNSFALEPMEGALAFMRDAEGSNEHLREQMEISKLEQAARELAQEARRAAADDRADLEQQLDAKLDEIFARKMALREQAIDHLSERLAAERAAFEERQQQRRQIIDRRKRQLLGESDHLKW